MKAFNTLVVVALSLVLSKNIAEASPVSQSLRRETLVDSFTGANLPSGSTFVARDDLPVIENLLTGLLGLVSGLTGAIGSVLPVDGLSGDSSAISSVL